MISKINSIVLSDPTEIAKQYKFNLLIPTEDEPIKRNFRLSKKSFAIVCHSSMTSKRCIYKMNLTRKKLYFEQKKIS